jgi:hypothetical protein
MPAGALTVFPRGKHDDQVDSTAQFLDWLKAPITSWGIYEATRRKGGATTTSPWSRINYDIRGKMSAPIRRVPRCAPPPKPKTND